MSEMQEITQHGLTFNEEFMTQFDTLEEYIYAKEHFDLPNVTYVKETRKAYYNPKKPKQPTITGNETFEESTQVSMYTSTRKASIYYTLDGSTPTKSSTLYSSPFTLSATTTVKAISAKGSAQSTVATKEFIHLTLTAPIISGETKFEETTQVTITCETAGASIYYTLDDATPTTGSTLYSAPITLSTTTTVKAISALNSLTSEVVSKTFSLLDYATEYLTFKAQESGTFTMKIPSAVTASEVSSVSYSTNNGTTWVTTQNDSTVVTITTPSVASGNTVLWKGSGTTFSVADTIASKFSSTGKFEAQGNIMSMLYGDDFIGQYSLSGKTRAFGRTFNDAIGLTHVENLVLPATTLSNSCYQYLFYGCKSLITVPKLPATTLANNCYKSMFNNCTNLTVAPILPATVMKDHCYESMFSGCTSLTTAPSLPATTLANSCYSYMFSDCSGLTTAPVLSATTLADNCCSFMFYGCANLTTAPELPATTLGNYCYNNMFRGCTSLTAAPELPATTLTERCYNSMFSGCIGLLTAPSILPATTLAVQCYKWMFTSCRSLTKAPELPATTLDSECYYGMFNACSHLNYIKCLATDISASACTYGWVTGVAQSGTFVKDPNMSGWTRGGIGIPSRWNVVDNRDYVEIGGIKWATMNVGANSITNTGLYFQWGDTSGYTASQVGSGQKAFDWSDYKFNPSGDGSTMTKYNSTDSKTVLDAEDDAVTAAWGGNWRMPTTAELQALGSATTSAWTSDYDGSGVAGLVLTDNTDSSKVLFFPACGLASSGSVINVGSYGFCWSSSLYSSAVRSAYYLYFSSSGSGCGFSNRRNGFPVRAVQ